MRQDLEKWFINAKKTIIIGIGNPLRKDDAIGIEIIRRLEDKVSSNVYLINSETVPENYIEPISEFKPTHILIIDAALMDSESSTLKFVENWKDSPLSISTHMLPIQVFCAYLMETTKAKIAMLLIQPEEYDFGEGLTPNLEKTADKLACYLLEIPGIKKNNLYSNFSSSHINLSGEK